MFIFFIFEYNVGMFMAFGIIAITCQEHLTFFVRWM